MWVSGVKVSAKVSIELQVSRKVCVRVSVNVFLEEQASLEVQEITCRSTILRSIHFQ